jgi:prepilin-type N-terminal cleavage/methylation domain-containing protein
MRAAVTISIAGSAARRGKSGGWGAHRAAFTLVELLVTMVIIAMLAALSLAGLAGVRQGAKADKTRNTIRKIDAVIRPMYDSYRTRRVSQAMAGASTRNYDQLLRDKRRLVIYEMPDNWNDVPTSQDLAHSSFAAKFKTAAVRAYSVIKPAIPDPKPTFGSAECLYMIVERSGFDADALEFFRADEIGDIDGDGKKEFLDGWGRPIAFLRWAPGFASAVQQFDAVSAHDPLDPMGRDSTAYALAPLIYSAGPDGALGTLTDDTVGYGLQQLDVGSDGKGWLSSVRILVPASGTPLEGLCTSPKNLVSGRRVGEVLPDTADTTALDNITNHDLTKK